MKIVIAPDSFKESLSAMQVAEAIEQGLKQVFPDADYRKVPMADGGEGTVQAMVDATGGEIIHLNVRGPLGNAIPSFYGILGATTSGTKTAVIEMAAASGLHLVARNERNPLITSSYGTGELIIDALNRGIRHIIIGLGGSATNDAGAGMLKALGFSLLNHVGTAIDDGGAGLIDLATIDDTQCHPHLKDCQFDIACDVDNPLCGPKGASAIFGPQKGATSEMVTQLDGALNHFAKIAHPHWNNDRLHHLPGAGAAGGMGFAIVAFLKGQLSPGVTLVANAVGLADTCKGATLVITGEGRIDGQTVFGKTPMGVLQTAQQYHVPVIGIAGCLGDNADAMIKQGMTAIFPIIPGIATLDQVLSQAAINLTNTSANIAALMKLSMSLNHDISGDKNLKQAKP
ncbi:glycerate kinase [Shewanella subflava]|uniref:Glycerate kinase n=1 Tax=Shewanella subflava TaxID=2986476 RepID=A0ABT3I595_9GAMM|nr:glycerate kinase [Shewanella subflava]MCW3171110.1 glycerate kinase [Shewanella subflava]